MRTFVSFIDWETAALDIRGKAAFSRARTLEISERLRESGESYILLSTCNRTELYSSSDTQKLAALCRAADLCETDLSPYFRTMSDESAELRLFMLACGLKSRILGEEQILTQIKEAAVMARDVKCSGAELQTLFRFAVTAGKEARTRVKLRKSPPSAASKAVEAAKTEFGGTLHGRQALVIGNGETGRLCARLLADAGCITAVTLRTYRHGETVIPKDCSVVAYDARYQAMQNCDLVFSATTSPHWTIETKEFMDLTRKPRFIADLAVPRDVDTALAQCPGVTLVDIDSLGGESLESVNAEAITQIHLIIKKRYADFIKWREYRQALPVLETVCL